MPSDYEKQAREKPRINYWDEAGQFLKPFRAAEVQDRNNLTDIFERVARDARAEAAQIAEEFPYCDIRNIRKAIASAIRAGEAEKGAGNDRHED